MLEYLLLLLSLIRATMRDREAVVTENLLLRHQLAVLTRPTRRRPRLRARDKLFWVVVRALRRDWRQHLVVVRPESVIRWHRQAWRLFWRWRSRGPIGRPRLDAEVRELIATMARDNPRWGSERIRGELLKPGLVVSKGSIQRYRLRGPAGQGPSSQTWGTFLHNHAHHLWAADLFSVQTLTFKTLYVLVFIAHGRRELMHVNVTANPTAAWVWRQLIEATPWGHKPRHLLRDHDSVYGRDFRRQVRRIGIDAIATPVASPRANAMAERVIGTLRSECLDHLISMSSTSGQYSPSLSSTTTARDPTGHCVSRRRCRRCARWRGQCDHGQCSVVCITCTSEQPDPPADFCAPTRVFAGALPSHSPRSRLARPGPPGRHSEARGRQGSVAAWLARGW